jgi:hypothetical protein
MSGSGGICDPAPAIRIQGQPLIIKLSVHNFPVESFIPQVFWYSFP